MAMTVGSRSKPVLALLWWGSPKIGIKIVTVLMVWIWSSLQHRKILYMILLMVWGSSSLQQRKIAATARNAMLQLWPRPP